MPEYGFEFFVWLRPADTACEGDADLSYQSKDSLVLNAYEA